MAKPINKTTVTALVAHKTASHVEILCEVPDHGAASMRLPFAAFDEKTRNYVQSNEAMERAVANLESIGLSFTSVEEEAPGTSFEAYYHDGKVTLWEPKAFTRFSPIFKSEARAIRNVAKTADFATIPLTEFEGQRFNFGIEVEIDGELKNFRISQFLVEAEGDDEADERISTKYATREITDFRNALEDLEMNPESRERAEQALDTMVAGARENLINTLNEKLKIDVEHMLQSDDALRVQISVESIAGSTSHYLVANVGPEGVEVIPAAEFGGGENEED